MPWDILLIFFVLGVIVPWRGRKRLQQLLAKPRVESGERLSLYFSTIAFQWIAASVAAWRALAPGYTPTHLGLAMPARFRLFAITLGGAVLTVMFQWFDLGRMGR